MRKILLGQDPKGRRICLDFPTLLRERLLVQGNSGAGKSYLLRGIGERAFGLAPIVFLDPEGEFKTLREKFPYLHVGPGGDTPTDIRSAALLARRILEHGFSAVCDLYELRAGDRHTWVRIFLEALINAPKELWRPVIVALDEAHLFCPEKGMGESEAAPAVLDLVTRGRKRGIASILATQRLAKLSKNAAAELLNVLIGKTFIDTDCKRAAEILGIPRSEEQTWRQVMRMTPPGEFWGFGRAISEERVKIMIAHVQTTHPTVGMNPKAIKAPPPPAAIKALLPKLGDLPKEAEEKTKTEAELRQELRALKIRLDQAERQATAAAARDIKADLKRFPIAPKIKRIPEPMISPADLKRLERVVERMGKAASSTSSMLSSVVDAVSMIHNRVKEVAARPPILVSPAWSDPGANVIRDVEAMKEKIRMGPSMGGRPNGIQIILPARAPAGIKLEDWKKFKATCDSSGFKTTTKPVSDFPAVHPAVMPKAEVIPGELPPRRVRILAGLAQMAELGVDQVPRACAAAMGGTTTSSSTFDKDMGALKIDGFIEYHPGKKVALTPVGRSMAGEVKRIGHWSEILRSP